MERPERYDPEDLEHLMLERGFDELLEEERAYALRHLEGRAEYERMRSLLLHIREEHDACERMDADPAVRERVLEAFRAHHKPRWEIWLNSVKAFLFPKRSSDLWRPALAFASVAAIVITSVVLWRSTEEQQRMTLAEVRQPSPKDASGAPAVEENSQTLPDQGPDASINTDLRETTRLAPAATHNTKEKIAAKVAEQDNASDQATVEAFSAASAITADRAAAPIGEMGLEKNTVKAVVTPAVGSSGEIVEDPVTVARRSERRMEAGRPAYTEDDLIGLLRAAW